MKNLIYYPNFESSDLNWLKFALLYIDNFSPIIPDTGIDFLSELYKKLQSETDLLNLQRLGVGAGMRATNKAIDYVTKVLENPHSFADELHSPNIVRNWMNKEQQTYTLFDEKYVSNWKWFCQQNGLAKDSKYGIDISKSLGEVYMTFLAQEEAYEKEASPITDNRYLDNLSMTIRSKDVANDNKIEVAKSIIQYNLPLDFSKISIDKVIEIRNKPDFKVKRSTFQSELDKIYDKIGKGISPNEFSDSYKKNFADWSGELTEYGIETVACGLSAYILLENANATNLEYIKEALEVGLVICAGKNIVKNINNNHERKYCRQYLTELQSIK
ncbi:hypothetical protein C8C85_3448 [Flavobacterium sp. 103]|jgi:hypothetical protein|uniref:Uncharacterized protein n=1 Tax=Flavobacterium aquariorum TaxID=2217670 RepID=A0A2W7VMI0_9FLAO|nr:MULTISPECIES: hypothetical protein [Flavobacterium]PVX47505.1 hypothetical protein C8C85_3448 [Flavobacterium sp. 103]PZX93352.1 hypothetical protein DOS84_10840 [Flavobacterium aquariorum]